MGAIQARARRAAAIAASGLAEVRFATKLTGLTQHADYLDVTVETRGETEILAALM